MRLINLSNRTYKTWILIILTMIIGAVLAGCAATRQARNVEMSDFLGIDPSLLRTGEKGQALLVYRNKTVDIAAYDTIMLDPVTVWWGIEVKKEMDLEDLQVLADNFYKLLYAELSEDYKIVGEPAGNTLRIQFAITNANKRSPGMDVISTVFPIGYAISAVKSLATGKHSFVGEASVEVDIVDAHTGEHIFAGVDSRGGGKRIGKGMGKWADVNNALEYWAKVLRYRLCVERGGTGCQRP